MAMLHIFLLILRSRPEPDANPQHSIRARMQTIEGEHAACLEVATLWQKISLSICLTMSILLSIVAETPIETENGSPPRRPWSVAADGARRVGALYVVRFLVPSLYRKS
eukprot:6171826-Pleurochrysis_carterae.AAC.2